MIEEPTLFISSNTLEVNNHRKPKACKMGGLIQMPECKKIAKPKVPQPGLLKPKLSLIAKDGLKRQNLDKVRKQLKFEHLPKAKPEGLYFEETAEEEEDFQPEDSIMQQPIPNQMEEEIYERKENMSKNTNFLSSLQINEKYAEKMLEKFLTNEKTFATKNFLSNHKITSFMRSKMIDWLIEVLTSYKCLDETFFLAVSLMDRFLGSTSSPQEVSELHLIGVTTIFIACKYEEIYPLRLQTVYERIAHKKLSCEQIKSKELEILESLDFNVTVPTVYDYVILLVHLIGLKNQMSEEKFLVFEKIISYISKLVIFEYDLIGQKPLSAIAAGVLYVSFKILEQIVPGFMLIDNMQKIKSLLGLEDNELIEVATQILWLAKNFDKLFQNLGNLKRFNTELFDQLQRMQNQKEEKNIE